MFDLNNFHGLKLLISCGGGAYGDVYYCEDISGKKMAVKIVSKKKLGDSWERELRGVINYRKITENAPGLLQIFHVEEDDESFFYTMEAADSASSTEYVPDTLTYRLQSGPLPQSDLLPVLSEVFDGIKLIHGAGFTHRDIKPDNILFVKGVPKLADIGLISSLSGTMTQLAGTLEFIPPEERCADSLNSSDRDSRQRNDLYAFGKVTYCAVTGMDAGEYPRIPADLPLVLPVKYFLRLSFQLCRKEADGRLKSIDVLAREFSDIKRKLLYGETALDKVKYTFKVIWELWAALWRILKKSFRSYWYLMLFFLLLGGGSAYWFWKPAPPYDITQEKSKRYFNAKHHISMQIPFHWEIISRETFNKLLKDLQGNKGAGTSLSFNEEQFNILLKEAEQSQGMICCDFDPKFADNITVTVTQIPKSEWDTTPDDELKLLMKTIFEGQLKIKTEIYKAVKTTVAGYPCILVDYSIVPGTRSNAYYVTLKNKTVMLTLIAKKKTFNDRRQKFESALKTLKIGSKK